MRRGTDRVRAHFGTAASLKSVGCAALTLAVLVSGAGGALAAGPVSVYPIPGSRTALPATQIVFRGVSPGSIGAVQVTGSLSGPHAGRIEADSDGQGGSFLPTTPFSPGERVTVATGLGLADAPTGTFHFQVVHPAGPIPPAPLPQVAAGRNGLQHFHSRPDLLPPSITVTRASAPLGPGDIFLAPQFGPAQDGPMVLDPTGKLVWFYPTPISSELLTTDFRVQQLGGQPVLTWWRGYTANGSGRGEGVILNDSYREIYIVKAGDGLQMDLHEFLVTPQGDAYFIAASPVLWPGVKRPVLDSVVQEVDIRTGLVLFEWHALDHIGLQESYFASPKASGHLLDPFHVNSISIDTDGNPIASARDTYAIYKINRATGRVIWRLGGKDSSFKMGPGASTAMQHDAVVQPDGTLTIFDDGAGPPRVHPQSRAIRVALDMTHMTASLVSQYNHSPSLSAAFEGSAQSLAGGDTFVGWGQRPYFSEFNPAGKLDFDANFNVPTSSYRAYRFPWSSQPVTLPAIAAAPGRHNTTTVYASWNGETAQISWRVLAGPSPSTLVPVATVVKGHFESTMGIRGRQRFVAVQAIGANGATLATSQTVAVG
jgi:hypothetical protein